MDPQDQPLSTHLRTPYLYTTHTNPEKFRDFNGIGTHGLWVSVAALYQLSTAALTQKLNPVEVPGFSLVNLQLLKFQ